jgi:hypothetical protein
MGKAWKEARDQSEERECRGEGPKRGRGGGRGRRREGQEKKRDKEVEARGGARKVRTGHWLLVYVVSRHADSPRLCCPRDLEICRGRTARGRNRLFDNIGLICQAPEDRFNANKRGPRLPSWTNRNTGSPGRFFPRSRVYVPPTVISSFKSSFHARHHHHHLLPPSPSAAPSIHTHPPL